jgi:hypothetical protein
VDQQQLQVLHDKQITGLKEKAVAEKKVNAKEIDSYLQVTQKENQVKALRKDLVVSKQKVTK